MILDIFRGKLSQIWALFYIVLHFLTRNGPQLQKHFTSEQKFVFLGQTRPLFCLFSFFSHDKYSTNTINEKA